MLKQGIGLMPAGLVLCRTGALSMTASLKIPFFGTHATDPLNLLTASGLRLAVGTSARYFPARQASTVDPMIALRDE